LGNGYERRFNDEKVLIDHTWSFLPPGDKNHIIGPGNYSYEFELALPGSLPETTQVARYYLVKYQLKAIAERSKFLPNYSTRAEVSLSRQLLSVTTDYMDPVAVANHWTDKFDYEISLPTKLYSYGDTIPVTVRVVPLIPNMGVRYVSCTFKEYMTCKAINGWFNGKNKSHGRIISYVRDDEFGPAQHSQDHLTSWDTTLNIEIPSSKGDIQCDVNNDSVRIRHKIKFIMSIQNNEGHISELRAVLPVIIAITNSIDSLPSYEETWRSLPYDPALMIMLLRRSRQSSMSNETLRRIQRSSIASYLPPYDAEVDQDHENNMIVPSYEETLIY
jgi:hypothetical protein